jgi:2-polyprenyl-3-methyl-5-hydroxy-6-metoxy-1,4-benzoquinol methylase
VPPPTTSQGSDTYWEENYGAPDEWREYRFIAQRVREARARVAKLEELRAPPARILELGCGTGVFVKEALDKGYSPTGIEPSRTAARAAAEYSRAPIRHGFLHEVVNRGESWDVVVAFHVLEHTAHPGQLLDEVLSVLAPGGLV